MGAGRVEGLPGAGGSVQRLSSVPQDWIARPGTVGRPVNGVTLHICDDDGNELPVGILTAMLGAPVFLGLMARSRYGFGGPNP